MSKLKNKILNLFLDNLVNDITPADMRIFVNSIFDSKENTIRKLNLISDISRIFPTPIIKNDLVVVYDDFENNGIYLVQKDQPTVNDLLLISGNGHYEVALEDLLSGETGKILSIDSGKLTWINQNNGYKILGTKSIKEILLLKPSEDNVIYIAEKTDHFSYIPGKIGDGYSWSNKKWTNIGQLRGEPGPAGEVSFEASQLEKTENGWRILGESEINHGIIGFKAIDLSFQKYAGENGATGDYSFAVGEGTIADESNKFSIGKYNEPKQDSIFEIGIGTNTTRTNAIEVYKDGRIIAPNLKKEHQFTNKNSLITREYIDDLIVDGGIFYS